MIYSENLNYLASYYEKIYRNNTGGKIARKKGKNLANYKRRLKGRLRKIVREKRMQPAGPGESKDAHIRANSLSRDVNLYGTDFDKNTFYEQVRLLAEADLRIFAECYPAFTGSIAAVFMGDRQVDKRMRKMSLVYYYQNYYLVRLIKGDISKMMPDSPVMQYPQARNMRRRFILHIGPTNSGKTYDAIERLKSASCGVYLGPLRLLALEIHDKMAESGIPCNMVTGEEEMIEPYALVTASTIEMLDDSLQYDIAVIDEAQMLADPHRGHNWTKAILGLCAREIHVCMAPESEAVVKKLIHMCGDRYEVVRHQRNTELFFLPEPFSLENVRDGDALIVFSKKSVLKLSSLLEERGVASSVIYGNLPPAARKEQIYRFISGQTQVVVSTDAIGMGVNLPIRRVVFMETEKYNGRVMRPLKPEEVRQIAGRAGRLGMYEEGFVQAARDMLAIQEALLCPPEELQYVFAGFAESLLDIPAELPAILSTWEKMGHSRFFRMMSVEETLIRYRYLQKLVEVKGSCLRLSDCDKHQVYQLISCPCDTREKSVMELLAEYLLDILERGRISLRFPVLAGEESLQALESHYKCLDLYHQVSSRFGFSYEKHGLDVEKRICVDKINNILTADIDKSGK